ncbi:MAG: alpha/beta hydrolase [Solobacterium sp.]|nr:alpha/beta hydrolase [Solobacterium sp.]
MKYKLYMICVLLFFLAVCFLMRQVFRRKQTSRFWRFFSAACAAILFLLCEGFVWLKDVYHAEDKALRYLESSGSVIINRTANGYLFDGPGSDSALIFYPGAKVEAEAYAPLLYSLAEAGEDVFLVRMPFQIAFLGINEAETLIGNFDYDSWYLAGHSMGGVAAAAYAAKHAEEISGIVYLASYPASDTDDAVRVLSVYGDQDGVLNMQAYENSRKYVPPGAQEKVIQGGNHAQFGNYGEQKGDGKALIPAEEQQEETVKAILYWLGK